MKIEPRQAEAFLKKPDPRIRGVVIYGNDDGLVAERAVALANDLSDWLQVPLEPTLSFSYPTISELAQHLAAPRSTPQAPTATHVLSELSEVEMYQLLAAELEVGKNHQDKK